MLAGTQKMTYAVITEIDIYRPTNVSGQFTAGSPADHVDKYDGTGKEITTDNWHTSGTGYLLSERCQGPLPNEAEMGVRMTWTYSPANKTAGVSFNITDWAVEKMAFCDTGCTQ